MFIVINCSTVELPLVEKYCASVAGERPVVFWNLELDSLRADLGLFGFPPKDVQHRFLSQILSAFYLRPRDYSKSVAVAPFIINYSGAVFREYPGPWQVMLKQDNGELACVAERKQRRAARGGSRPAMLLLPLLAFLLLLASRYALGEAKEELVAAMGLNTEQEGSAEYFARRGYKTATWWEEDEDKEESKTWRM